jgi:uncharacterized membrane protein YbhN (UPF0104 family)
MRAKYQNGFFIFGLVVLVVMITQLDFAQVGAGLQRAGYWFVAVIVLWGFLYLLNTLAWWQIIRSSAAGKQSSGLSFWWLYKVTVSGFALNYATPGGLMGGEPYRILSLSPKIGTERASSSVILYVMTHIFSHFWFWLLSVALYVLTQEVTPLMAAVLTIVGTVSVMVIWFFIKGYKKGIAVSGMNLLRHSPLIKRWARGFFDRHREQLAAIDRQIAALHNQNRRRFVTAVLLELACRILSTLEIFFILLVILPSVNIVQCILIYAFTTLFANMLFFMPLQLGGREGGFMMSIKGLGMSVSAGIFVALLVRMRELIWTAIGLLLIKFDKKKKQ